MITEVHAESFTISDIRVTASKRVLRVAYLVPAVERRRARLMTVAWSKPLVRTVQNRFLPGYPAGRDGDVLVITVVERPSISGIEIEGNKAISSEDLLKGPLNRRAWLKVRFSSAPRLKAA